MKHHLHDVLVGCAAIINGLVLYGYDKRYYLAKETISGYGEQHYGHDDKFLWRHNSKEEATEKIRKLLNKKDWTFNTKETEFFIIENLEEDNHGRKE